MPDQIICVDCGGDCYRLSHPPHEGDDVGEVVSYRCRDCLDRWDLIVDEDDVAE